MTAAIPVLELDNFFAEPGGRFEGRVMLPGAEGLHPTTDRIREVRVTLSYATQGRGDSDSRDGPTQTFEVNVDGSLHGTFALDVPAGGPISYDGALIRLVWTIEARTDLRLRIDKKTKVEVAVVPVGGLGLYTVAHPLN